MSPEKLKLEIESVVKSYKKLAESNDKDDLKSNHILAKFSVDSNGLQKALSQYKKYKKYFIDPDKITISKISPKLVNVSESREWEILFNIARRTWSMPFNKGYGRRLRYLVFDTHHEAVMGIIGLQSPPADLACRDSLFNYPLDKKLDLVNQTMDIYSLGSIPPYSGLLGGKLVAGLAASRTIVDDYKKKYASRETLLEHKILDNSLVALTTTSAFGRSSIYNRLKYKNRLIAEPIGYTKGYGNLHLESIYPELVNLLKENDLFTGGGYGNGPKQRWQNITRALALLKLPNQYARHGVLRQVFLYRLTSKLESGMSGKSFGQQITHDEKRFSNYWLKRWATPRAQRDNSWLEISTEDYILNALSNNQINSSQ